jgi:acetyl esterase
VPKSRAAAVPAILYIHGGGFYAGSIDTEHSGASALARQLNVVVVSVDYRLAPENPFPAGLEDCYAALVWLHEHAGDFGVDADRIAINGGSAGGGLAAGLALLARDRGGPAICFQYLGIPELDDRLDTPSMQRFHDTPMWSRGAAEKSWEWYLGDAHGTVDISPYAAPARATDVAGLPPAYISTMEFDPLRDEGIHYALKLLAAGVSVELHSFPGTFHGSGIVVTAAVNQREAAERMTVWRRVLGLDSLD